MLKKLLVYRSNITFAIAVLVFVFGAGYYYTHEDQIKEHRRLLATASIPSMLTVPDKLLQLDPMVKSSDCKMQGFLPDHQCTPGSVFANATKEIICVHGYSKTVRKVSLNLKKKVYAAYNVAYPQPFGTYELDHLIPLSLGGDNGFSNLSPIPAIPAPGFKEKDLIGNYLLNEVCAGNIALTIVQEQIANDWVMVYEALTPGQITMLKKRYKSWAD